MKILLTLFGLAGLSLVVASPPKQLSDFVLSDQNSVIRRYGFPKQKVTVMTVADRTGSEQLEPWITNLYEHYGSQLHSVVRALFRKRLAHSVMLDWDGAVVKRLDYERGVANIYVIDRCGTIRKRITGPLNATVQRDLFRTIDGAIADNRTQ